ncbi:hypothetical protein E2C01_025776 [Portunus trituberculatus]|uniref:Uncharacterized protein n=1 Tax=Portunus trituberculatus TaxID=210409 RepID=A0A5B7EGE8_PORTR|nr:hypothetical protein [Portunus trituberculatus]
MEGTVYLIPPNTRQGHHNSRRGTRSFHHSATAAFRKSRWEPHSEIRAAGNYLGDQAILKKSITFGSERNKEVLQSRPPLSAPHHSRPFNTSSLPTNLPCCLLPTLLVLLVGFLFASCPTISAFHYPEHLNSLPPRPSTLQNN